MKLEKGQTYFVIFGNPKNKFRPWVYSGPYEDYPLYIKAYTRLLDKVYLRVCPIPDARTWFLE